MPKCSGKRNGNSLAKSKFLVKRFFSISFSKPNLKLPLYDVFK